MGKKSPPQKPIPRISADLRKERTEKLKAIFPESVTETKVDFEKLCQSLGDAVDDQPERYSFTWAGKRNAIRLLQTPSRATLIPVPEESVDFNTTQNLFIEGDNLEVLKLLYKPYAGQVKMVYIDPPYNTGNDFVYPDNFADPLDSYLQMTAQKDGNGNLLTSNPETNGRYHSAWLSMMYPRLFIARQLLRDDGVIFVSIDDHEIHNLRMMMNEIFGEENFVAQLVWKGRSGAEDDDKYRRVHEYILVFGKKVSEFDSGLEEKNGEKFPKYDEKKERHYKTQLLRKWGDNSRKEDRPNLYYPILGPDGKDFYPTLPTAEEGCWRWDKKRMQHEISEGNVEFCENRDGSLEAYEKIYAPEEHEKRLKKFNTWLDKDGNSARGTKECKKLFDGVKIFDRPKPVSLLNKLFSLCNLQQDDIVLDFFTGSGTTAHAMMELNAEDGNNRQCISVQLPEKCAKESAAYKAGYRTIADIAKERIRRAGKRIAKDAKNSSLDTGFKVFKLSKSNYKQWTGIEKKDSKNYTKTMKLFADPLVPSWKTMDVIYEVTLKEGYGLCSTIDELKEIKDNTIYRVTDPDKDQFFCICLDDKIKPSTVKAMDSEKRDLFVCRDIALTDGLAANLALQCRLKTI